MLSEALFHVSDSLNHAYIAICANWFHAAHQCHYDSNSTVGGGNETENVSECEIVLSSPVCVYRDSISTTASESHNTLAAIVLKKNGCVYLLGYKLMLYQELKCARNFLLIR